MNSNSLALQRFHDLFQQSEDIIALASKEDLAEAARVLAIQSAYIARHGEEMQLPELTNLLAVTTDDDESVSLLCEATAALVDALASIVNCDLQGIRRGVRVAPQA